MKKEDKKKEKTEGKTEDEEKNEVKMEEEKEENKEDKKEVKNKVKKEIKTEGKLEKMEEEKEEGKEKNKDMKKEEIKEEDKEMKTEMKPEEKTKRKTEEKMEEEKEEKNEEKKISNLKEQQKEDKNKKETKNEENIIEPKVVKRDEGEEKKKDEIKDKIKGENNEKNEKLENKKEAKEQFSEESIINIDEKEENKEKPPEDQKKNESKINKEIKYDNMQNENQEGDPLFKSAHNPEKDKLLEKKRKSSDKDRENKKNEIEEPNSMFHLKNKEEDSEKNDVGQNNFNIPKEELNNEIKKEENKPESENIINNNSINEDIPKKNVIVDNIGNQNIINEMPNENINNGNNPNSTNDFQNNVNQINMINFQALQMQFQMMVQKYLQDNGYENNFLNNYYNFNRLETKNDKEKEMIKYLQTEMNNSQPNIINGLVILNTQIPSLGLQNVGATCYMNSTLQCLIHIKELSETLLSAYYLKYPFENVSLIEKHKLTLEYVNILKQVYFPKFYGNDSLCFAPYKFKELIGELNPLFSGIMANDAKDLLQFILEKMHTETKMAMQYFCDYNIDQTDELQALQYFFNSYVYQSNSPFLQYLYGIIKIKTECLKCHTIKYNFQSYNLLYFPLKESKNHILDLKKEDKDFDQKNYILNLEDCFSYNEKIDHFFGDNSMYCNICHDLQEANYQSMLYSTPPVLAIVLNRGKANADFKEKFNFSTELDIVKYLHNEEKKGKYYLISMVVHFGESSMSGHFMAYCRMDKDSKWFCYNDAYVSECKDFEDIIKRGTPYILFYHQE